MNQLNSKWNYDNLPKIVPAEAPARPLPPIIGLREFLAEPPSYPPELVRGFIHQGTQTMLAGGSKSFKTWSLLDLGMSVAAGVPWWGRETVQSKVLYLNMEIDAPFFHKRASDLLDAKELTLPDAFDLWNLRGYVADVAKLLPEILERCEGAGYGLIIPDPIYKLLGGRNENAAGEVAEFLNHLDELAVRTGAAIVYGHHFAKGLASGKESLDRASGSGVFSRHPDGIVTLTRHEEEGAFVVEATLRNFKPVAPFVVRWEHPLMRLDEQLDPNKLKATAGRPATHKVERLLACLESGMTKPEWKKAAAEQGMSTSTFYNLAKQAEEKVLIASYQEGQKLRWRKLPTVVSFKQQNRDTASPAEPEAA